MYACSTFVAGKGVITEPKRVDFEVFGWILNGWMVGWLDGSMVWINLGKRFASLCCLWMTRPRSIVYLVSGANYKGITNI